MRLAVRIFSPSYPTVPSVPNSTYPTLFRLDTFLSARTLSHPNTNDRPRRLEA
jgi:hypothetical protein